MFKELLLLEERNLRNFSFCKTFITANNKKLGGRFHLFTAKYHMDAFIKLLSSLFLLLAKMKGKTQNFDLPYVCSACMVLYVQDGFQDKPCS